MFLATHFDHRRDPRERVASAKEINRLISGQPRPALLAGDLNDIVGRDTLNELETHWMHTNREPLATIPVDQPKRQIDFILCRPRGRWKVLEVRVLDEAIASDHRAIFAHLEWNAN